MSYQGNRNINRQVSLFDYHKEFKNKPRRKWPKKPFITKESYKHKFAKQILFDWLKGEQESKEDKCELLPFSWRINWGVHLELPFYQSSDPYYFEIPKKKDDDTIIFVPDITIFHKGTPKYLIEVVYKNHVTPSKLITIEQFFDGYSFQLHEIEAEIILIQTEKPKYLKTNLIIDRE